MYDSLINPIMIAVSVDVGGNNELLLSDKSADGQNGAYHMGHIQQHPSVRGKYKGWSLVHQLTVV